MEVSKLLSVEKLYQTFIKSGRKLKVKKSFYSELLTFLADGYFAKLWKGLKNETRLNLKKYKLSDFEQLALVSYVGPLAHVFQHESYSNLLFPIRNICNALDSVLLKAPIFVDSSCEEDEFPVLLMDWIDGETMESYIAENYQDNYTMAMLCYRFCKMAAWLRSQPFAHGDIKPDNIMVRPDGNLTLVDYDGMFVPAMKGQKSPTIGTKDFSHPLRTVDDFDETIDDFALASIALSLKAISLKPSLFDEYGAADRLLFSAEDYRDWGHTEVCEALREELVNKSDMEIGSLVSIFSNVCNGLKNIKNFDFVSLPLENVKESSTEVLVADLKNTIVDDFGVKYSRDKMKLLKAPNNIKGLYRIKKGTKIICNNAFDGCYFLTDINMPNSVKYIGIHVFQSCI